MIMHISSYFLNTKRVLISILKSVTGACFHTPGPLEEVMLPQLLLKLPAENRLLYTEVRRQ